MSESMRDYSPEKLFKLIKSDADVEHYSKLYNSRYSVCYKVGMACGLLILFFIIGTFSFYTDSFAQNYPVTTNSIAIIAGLVLISFYVCIFVTGLYNEIIKALQPMSGSLRCVEINHLISDYAEARHARDEVLKQGRQLYGFDADYIVDLTKYKEPDLSQSDIDSACKNLYGINNQHV